MTDNKELPTFTRRDFLSLGLVAGIGALTSACNRRLATPISTFAPTSESPLGPLTEEEASRLNPDYFNVLKKQGFGLVDQAEVSNTHAVLVARNYVPGYQIDRTALQNSMQAVMNVGQALDNTNYYSDGIDLILQSGPHRSEHYIAFISPDMPQPFDYSYPNPGFTIPMTKSLGGNQRRNIMLTIIQIQENKLDPTTQKGVYITEICQNLLDFSFMTRDGNTTIAGEYQGNKISVDLTQTAQEVACNSFAAATDPNINLSQTYIHPNGLPFQALQLNNHMVQTLRDTKPILIKAK